MIKEAIKVFFIFGVILLSVSSLFAQGRRDLKSGRNFGYKGSDTSKFSGKDTLSVIDSTMIFVGDSLSTQKYFAYSPKSKMGSNVFEKNIPLLLGDASSIAREVLFDSSGNVIIKQTLNEQLIRAPSEITLQDYLVRKDSELRKEILNQIVYEKFKGEIIDDLSKLIEKFTDITIPLPFKSETIFGPPTINLRINGTVDLTASYQSVTSDQLNLSFNTDQNNINFKQDLQITAKGSVGDKLTIDADWNTQRTFEFENQLRIKYTGYADEVIQKIEAGNVSLDTKSSLIQSTQALFGVRGEFKLGKLTLSTVFSQKKSKQEEQDYKGGNLQQDFTINVYDYSDNHYFLDTIYRSSFLDKMNRTDGQYKDSTLANQIKDKDLDFEVWVQTQTGTGNNKRQIIAVTMLQDTITESGYRKYFDSTAVPGSIFIGSFRKLTSNEYYIDQIAGFITLKISINPNDHVGVTYSTQGYGGIPGKKFGWSSSDRGAEDTLVIKMIKTQNQNPTSTPLAWKLKMKNVYRLPVSKIIKDDFSLKVEYNNDNNWQPNLPSGPTKSLSTMTGIDRYDDNLNLNPDNKFDYRTSYTIYPETGDIIFPYLEPFSEGLNINGVDSSFQFKGLYNTPKNEANTLPLAGRYRISGSAKGEAGISNTINLGFNVVQGSVKIKVGQQQLIENIDYSVDYSTGTVVIRNSAALLSKDLKITYETNDLFSLASKTLIGARADYKFSEKTNLGFTFVNLKQESLNDKVRIGEEPTNNSMFGFDFSTEMKSKTLTNLVNLLPGFNTKEESAFNFRTEVAAITPDPNTRKSVIPQDNGESIAYIDDMEGAKKIISVQGTYASWSVASLPGDSSIAIVDSVKQFHRSKMNWYNIPSDIDVKQVYPNRDVQAGQDRLTPLYVEYKPARRGTFNMDSVNFATTQVNNRWNGIMKFLNTTSTDLLNENINFIEFNMRIEAPQGTNFTNAKLKIDLGQVSEDAIPNRKFNTEDTLGTGNLDPNFNVGLDMLRNDQETALFNQINGTNFGVFDASLDDNYTGTSTIIPDLINGTENNLDKEGGQKPDTEDLNRNSTLDTYNSYFEYEISLDTTNNYRISGRGASGSGWYQYRIPLSEFSKMISGSVQPTFTNIEYIRVWLSGVDQEIRLAFVDFNLVGNQWFKTNKTDTTYNISVVSIEENSQIYQSPVPGDLLRQTVRNQNSQNTKSNEGSLAVFVSNLTNGQRKLAVKDYKTQTLDIFNYKAMKLFVNGDPSFNYVNEFTYDAAMVIRFGTDSNNFYEYRAPIHPDIRPGSPWNSQNEVTIVFSDLTTLKVSRDSINQVVDKPVPNGPPGAIYRIKGNPSLSAIRTFELGIEKNKTGVNSSVTGSVWFNEMRVINVNDENGFAMNMNATLKLADFANFAFNFSKTDPNFHTIDSRSGTRTTGQTWEISGTVNAHKLINNLLANIISTEWKDFINLPISFRHSENFINPRYYPGTDIELDNASQEKYRQVLLQTNDPVIAEKLSSNIRGEAQTLNIRDEFSITGAQLKIPSTNFFVEKIVNALVFNFAAQSGFYRDITFQTKTDFTYNGSIAFNTDFGLAKSLNLDINNIINLGDNYKNAKIYLFFPSIALVPFFSDRFSATVDFTRSRNEQKQRALFEDDPIARIFRANRGFNFNWKFIENWVVDMTGNYSVKIGSDLTGFETKPDSLRTQKTGGEILKEILFNESLVNFGKDLDYQQAIAFNPKFNLPFLGKFFDVNLNYNVTYGWTNPNATSNIGYNVGYANSINSTAIFKINEIFKLFESGDTKSPFRDGLSGQSLRSDGKKGNKDDPKTGIGDILKIIKSFIPDQVSMTFSQTNSVANPGVNGRPGFANFWLPFFTEQKNGPSQWYQLGFKRDPGPRVPNLLLTDVYNLNNVLNFTATITPILPNNVRINLNFKDQHGFNNANSYTTREDGSIEPTNKSSSTTSAHSIFFGGVPEDLTFTQSTIPEENTENISNAFKSTISSFPFPNWSLTITGLEAFPLFAEFAQTVTLENTFTSEYNEATSLDARGLNSPVRQEVSQAFNPLIGLNVTFKQFLGGSLNASFRYNTSQKSTLTPASSLIQTLKTNDLSITANFAKSGFEIPFFGLSLKNDIAFVLSITRNKNEPVDYRYTTGTNPEILTGNGSIITTINPSIQYSISSKVQMQLFYKYVNTEPLEKSVSTVPRTSKEGGLNIRISIN